MSFDLCPVVYWIAVRKQRTCKLKTVNGLGNFLQQMWGERYWAGMMPVRKRGDVRQ